MFFHGSVESIGFGITSVQPVGTGTALPYVSPQLSWIKLAQRFPVTILINNPDKQYPLRIGANARVTIHTTPY